MFSVNSVLFTWLWHCFRANFELFYFACFCRTFCSRTKYWIMKCLNQFLLKHRWISQKFRLMYNAFDPFVFNFFKKTRIFSKLCPFAHFLWLAIKSHWRKVPYFFLLKYMFFIQCRVYLVLFWLGNQLFLKK